MFKADAVKHLLVMRDRADMTGECFDVGIDMVLSQRSEGLHEKKEKLLEV